MAKTAAPSLDSHDGSLGLNDAELEGSLETVAGISLCGLGRQMNDSPNTVIHVGLPVRRGHAAGLGVVHWVYTAGQVKLSRGLGVASDTDDGALRAVLGDIPGRVTRGGEDDDGAGVLLHGGGNGGEGKGLGGGGGADGERPKLVEEGRVCNGRLGEESSLGHHLD